MVAINNRATGKVEEHSASFTPTTTGYESNPTLAVVGADESRARRIAFIRAGGGHPSYDPDDNPHGRTPGDDGWNSPQTAAQKALARTEKKRFT